MKADQTDTQTALRKLLGATQPPSKITQDPYDGNERQLRRLARLKPGEESRFDDLYLYVRAVRSTKIDAPFFVYMLPVFLDLWRDELRGTDRGEGGTLEYFWGVLADPNVFEVHLSAEQAQVVSDFLRRSIVEEIDEQRGLEHQGRYVQPYRWMGALTTYGVIRPDIERLWAEWWSLDTVGRAIASVEYISCLMYPSDLNPVFAPWTKTGGGGPPCLWAFEGHIYERQWLEPNIRFLRRKLKARNVEMTLGRA